MIFNDWSARQLQSQEMKLNLGPAKGKDFASSMGPMLVTPDEWEAVRCPAPPGHRGTAYRARMRAWINGILMTDGNLSDMSWTFAELIERCSLGVDLWPGDVIGSGCVGGGCLLERNGTRKRKDPEAVDRWLEPGDVVDLEVEGLGRLQNTVVCES
jgi:fumarylacetoacetate (FAA) hydrolase